MSRRRKRRIARWFSVLLDPYCWPRGVRRTALLFAPVALPIWGAGMIGLVMLAILARMMRPILEFWNAEAAPTRDERVQIATWVRNVPVSEIAAASVRPGAGEPSLSPTHEPAMPLLSPMPRLSPECVDERCTELALFETSGLYVIGSGRSGRLN